MRIRRYLNNDHQVGMIEKFKIRSLLDQLKLYQDSEAPLTQFGKE